MDLRSSALQAGTTGQNSRSGCLLSTIALVLICKSWSNWWRRCDRRVPMCRILSKASHHGNVKLCWVRRIIEMKWYAHGCAQTPPRRRRPKIFKKLWLVPDTTKTRHGVLVVKNVVTALIPIQPTKMNTGVCLTMSTDHWCQTIRNDSIVKKDSHAGSV